MHTSVLLSFVLLPLSLAKDWPVDVGEDGLVFSPSSVTAAKGDNVVFTFYPMNHSVAQSSFDKPCYPIDNAIFSGFEPVLTGKGDKPFTITIKDDKPIWIYCSQGSHCQDGMVMGINAPNTGNTLVAYKQASSKATENVSPDKPSNGTTSGGSSSSSSSAGSSSSSSSSAGSSSSSSSSAGSSSTGTATGTKTGTTSSTGSATSSSNTAQSTNAAGSLNAGVGMGVMGLLGVLAGGMI